MKNDRITSLVGRVRNRINREVVVGNRQLRERRMAYRIAAHTAAANEASAKGEAPVVFFNASTRIVGLSYNAAYQQLAAWALRLQGVPVVHFVCGAGMSRCVQGTNRDDHTQAPPCRACMAESRSIYAGTPARDVAWVGFSPDAEVAAKLENLSLAGLMEFTCKKMPLGALVAPSIRWVLRRYRLFDDEPTRFLCRQYILSAWSIANAFSNLIGTRHPRAVVLFNGTFFPEAAVRWVARQQAVPVITHESAFLPFSGFFTPGEATAYPLDPPEDFIMTEAQNARLDEYLEQRFQGNFSMAGIRFWPEIRGLDAAFLKKLAGFRQMVPVFTNVIFDTSQGHANVLFEDMFVWLDQLLEVIRRHPETYFVIRAHPDEGRIGKASRETVSEWFRKSGANGLPNVSFIDANETISSYELVQRSKFVLIYNSMIGLEASIMGSAVLSGGKVRYHTNGCRTIIMPGSAPAYFSQIEEWLTVKRVEVSPELQRNARRFLYYQIFLASLPFDRYLQAEGSPGFVSFRNFHWEDLLPERSATMRVLVDGVLNASPFLLGD